MFKITFNGADIPSFIKVRTVDFAVLPTISHSFKPIAGGRGLLEAGTSIGEKTLKMKIVIVPTDGKSLTDMARELAYWLQGNNFKLCDLVISDDSTKMYRAKINNAVDISDLMYIGEGELEFVVPSGVAKGTELTGSQVSTGADTFIIMYNGTAPSRPIITWTPSSTLTGVTINFTCVETGKLISLTGTFTSGVAITIDCEKKVVKRGAVVDMKLINYTSDWITLPSRGTYNITWNQAGTYTTSCKEYWL